MIQKTDNFVEVKNIRIKIFQNEMGLSNNDIFDSDDKFLEQFLIKDGEKTIGTFRLRDLPGTFKIERMGILPQFRRQGFGKVSLEKIKIYSKKQGKTKLILDSIFDIKNFYSDSGFFTLGEKYSKVGIPHVKMAFNLE